MALDARAAWLGLAAYVGAVDLTLIRLGRDSMSGQHWAWVNDGGHPSRRWVAWGTTAYLIAHLNQWLPREWDPLNRVGARLRR